MTLQKGEILKKVLKEFKAVGYKVKYRLLLASNFGIPQRRERLFIVGVRNDIDVDFQFPQDTHSENSLFIQKSWVPLCSVIDNLEIEEKKYYFSQKAVDGMKNAKNNMKRGLFQDLNKQCLTITSHLAKTSLNSRDPVLLVNPEKEIYRRFTPREAARIQSFPDDFKLPVSETQAYKQIGNAIPPVLMWHVANALSKSVNTEKSVELKTLKQNSVPFERLLQVV
jgi:DNA (cytosine-5)-methyltransferase 1